MPFQRIRNFVIIAHIDHGKSTLADRFLEVTGSVEKRKMKAQYLDQMELEKEKGITIKMQPVRMVYHPETRNTKLEIQNKSEIQNQKLSNNFGFRASDFEFANSDVILNLIDTPGHVDFSYEVSRALAAVEGAILLVDATQGVQAQTIANLHMAQKEGLVVIPAVNKIDLPSAEVARTKQELCDLLAIEPEAIFEVSAKTGVGVEALLNAVVEKIPPPAISEDPNAQTRALVFDSKYDPYQGVLAHVRVFEGTLSARDRIRFLAASVESEIGDVGTFAPQRVSSPMLSSGEIGYIATGLKEPGSVRVGDTVTVVTAEIRRLDADGRGKDLRDFASVQRRSALSPLEGYKEPAAVVFSSFFPENQDDYEDMRDALEKLKFEDAALMFEPEESSALGRGFRIGFLGMLHMEIISERLQREYGMNLVITNPSVAFKVRLKNRGDVIVYSASRMPGSGDIDFIEEPMARVEVVTPPQFLGALATLIHEHQGIIGETTTLAGERALVVFEAPLREIIIDFYDALKSMSQGFASLSYEISGYRQSDLVTMDIIVAGEKVPALSEVLPVPKAHFIARARVVKLKELMARTLFPIALQAEIQGRIIARETIPAMKKDVTGYLYGGDRTRKMKLWKKQQRGKKRMKEQGHVEIPPEVFLKLLKRG